LTFAGVGPGAVRVLPVLVPIPLPDRTGAQQHVVAAGGGGDAALDVAAVPGAYLAALEPGSRPRVQTAGSVALRRSDAGSSSFHFVIAVAFDTPVTCAISALDTPAVRQVCTWPAMTTSSYRWAEKVLRRASTRALTMDLRLDSDRRSQRAINHEGCQRSDFDRRSRRCSL